MNNLLATLNLRHTLVITQFSTQWATLVTNGDEENENIIGILI